jgi:hypothetical protein
MLSAKQQVLSLFGRYTTASPDTIGYWSRAWRMHAPDHRQNPTFQFAGAHLLGAACNMTENPRLQLYVAGGKPGQDSITRLPAFLSQVIPDHFPNIPVEVLITGRFRAALTANLGAGVSLDSTNEGGNGAITLFLKDSGRSPNFYALTCQHVLDGEIGDDVYIDGDRIGSLAALIAPNAGLPSRKSLGDAALVLLDPGVFTNSLPPAGVGGAPGRVTGVTAAHAQNQVTLVNDNLDQKGKIESTSVDLTIDYANGPASFEDLVTVAKVNINPGDSGTLAVYGNSAQAMVIAKSPQSITSDGKNNGPVAVLLDLQRMLNILNPMIGSILTPL